MERWLAVFCGSRGGHRQEHAAAARELGAAMAERRIGLVFGGGSVGLMGAVADAVLAGGGAAMGVLPRGLAAREIRHQGVQEMILTDTMHERKGIMAARADAFVALPGGFGTMDELFEILTWAQLGIHRKPVMLLNVAGHFDLLLRFLDHTWKAGFVSDRQTDLLRVVSTVPDVLAGLDATPPEVPAWQDRSEEMLDRPPTMKEAP